MSNAVMPQHKEASVDPDFEQMFRDHAGLIYRTAFAVLGSREDADDVLQTIFLRLLRREAAPDLNKNPEGYFYRAAVNASLDALKKRRRQPSAMSGEQVEACTDSGARFDDEMHDRLYRAIAQLSSETAEILLLRYIHNLSDADIAKKLGVSRTRVAVRLFRARARLKKIIRDMGERDETR